MADTARQLICLSQFIFALFGKTIYCLTDFTQLHWFVSARQFKIVLPRLNICLSDISFVCCVFNLGQTIYIVLPRLPLLLSCSTCIKPRKTFEQDNSYCLAQSFIFSTRHTRYIHTRLRFFFRFCVKPAVITWFQAIVACWDCVFARFIVETLPKFCVIDPLLCV